MPHRAYSALIRSTLACFLLLLAAQAQADKINIVLYPGYGTTQHFTLEGRVIEARQASVETADDSRFTNLKRSARRLVNDEQANIPLRISLDANVWAVKSDQEGYFLVDVSGLNIKPGWHEVEALSGSIHGEHDPEIYREIQKRFPTRITQVLIRRVHPDPARARYPEQAEFNPSPALESRP